MRPFDRRPVSSGFFSPTRVSYRPQPDELESRPDTLNLRPSDLEHQTTSIEYPPFKKLPIELIVSISELLPPHSAALFTLTSRLVSISSGTKYLDQLRAKNHENEQLAFLDSLQRDLPRYIICHDCRRLHSNITLRHDTEKRSATKPCDLQDWTSGVDRYIQAKFSSATFRLAMKLDRHGIDCRIQLSSLTKSLFTTLTGYNRQWESTPRIRNGHFLLRNQLWYLFPLGWAVEVPSFPVGKICPHLEFPGAKLGCRVHHMKNAKLNATCLTCTGMYQCRYCLTEYRIDYKDFGDGVAFVVTSWLDLGDGRTSSDPVYQNHVLRGSAPQLLPELPRIEPGSIRAAYEEERILTPQHNTNMFTKTMLLQSQENGRFSDIKHTTKRDRRKETGPSGTTSKKVTIVPMATPPDTVVPKEITRKRAPVFQYVNNLFIFLDVYASTADFQILGILIAVTIACGFPAWKDIFFVLSFLAAMRFLIGLPTCKYAVKSIGLQDSLGFPRWKCAIATFIRSSTLHSTTKSQSIVDYMADKLRSLLGIVLEVKEAAEKLFIAASTVGGTDGAAENSWTSPLVVENKVERNRPLRSGGGKLSIGKTNRRGAVSQGQGGGSGVPPEPLEAASNIEITNDKDRLGGRIWKLGVNGRLIRREGEKRRWR